MTSQMNTQFICQQGKQIHIHAFHCIGICQVVQVKYKDEDILINFQIIINFIQTDSPRMGSGSGRHQEAEIGC